MNLILTYLKSNYKLVLSVLAAFILYFYISALNAKIDSLKEELNISQQKSELFFSQLLAERQRCNQQVEDDIKKSELIKLGEWRPTAKPSEPDFYSYHISALYAPTFMFNWEHYVRQYLEANPVNGRRNEAKHKTFVNLVLGETYEQEFESASAVELMNNIRDYEIGTIPEKLSIRDGNGRIVMITLGSDLNGKEDDARLDYEILAHSESGATYSIIHGSIGTFVNKDTKANQRAKWTYRRGVDFSVWVEFDKIIKQRFVNDNTGDRMSIFFACVDSGYMHDYAYKFVADQSANVVALKGEEYDKPSL
jgi:phage terminase large subunit GpA-like protein